MERYIIHLKNQSYTPKDAKALLNKARSLASDSIVRDSRVSTHYIEFDISLLKNKSIEDFLDKFTLIAPLSQYEQVVEKQLEKEKAIKYARTLFNDERYWEAHEILEPVWKNSHEEEKDLLNGIILIAAAFVHDEKDESDICISILKRAMKKLSKASGLYFGMDVDEMKERVSEIVEEGKIKRFSI